MEDLELEKLKALALAEVESSEQSQEQAPIKQEEMEPVETGPVEAFTRSAAQTMMFDFADEVEAAFDTGLDYLSDEDMELSDWSTLSDTYGKNLEVAREEYQANKDAHPTADKLGLAAGIAGSVLTGSATAKGLAKIAPQAMRGFNALNTTQKAIRLGAVQSGISSLGMSDDKMSLDAALRVAGGTALGAAGGKVFGKVAESGVMDDIASGVGRAVQKSKAVMNMAMRGIGLGNTRSRNKFFKKLTNKGVKPEQWLDDIASEKMVTLDDTGKFIEGDSLLNDLTASYDDIYSRADDKIKYYAEARDSILGRSKGKIDRVGLANRVKSKVAKEISPEQVNTVNDAIDNLILYKPEFDSKTGQIVKGINDADLDLLGVSHLRKGLDDVINFGSSTNPTKLKRAIRDSLNDYTDTAAEALLTDADKLTNRSLRKKMSSLYDLQEALEKGANESFMSSANLFKDFIASKAAKQGTRLLTGRAGSEGMEALAVGLRRMTVSARVNRKTAMMAHELATAIPKASEKAMRRLLVASNGDDINIFNSAAASVISEVSLREMPLLRSSQDVISRKDTILPLVQSLDPELGADLSTAISNKDTASIGIVMDTLSKSPDAKGLIEQGIGWDGMVHSEEDRASLEDEIRSSNLPISQEIVLLEELNKQRKIPNIQPVQPFKREWSPRAKNKHDY